MTFLAFFVTKPFELYPKNVVNPNHDLFLTLTKCNTKVRYARHWCVATVTSFGSGDVFLGVIHSRPIQSYRYDEYIDLIHVFLSTEYIESGPVKQTTLVSVQFIVDRVFQMCRRVITVRKL